MAAPDSLSLSCPAKVNLALSVGAASGAGGYHPIASWMVAVRLADSLHLARTDAGDRTIEICFAPDAPVKQAVDWPMESDLAHRAAMLMRRRTGRPLDVAVRIEKRIPAGAGLGGGSADAAGMLTGLNRLFDLGLTDAELMAAGAELGCDVTFAVAALAGRPSAVATGTGTLLDPVPLSAAIYVVLILPPFGCPTAAVYAAFDERTGDSARVDEARVRSLAGAAILNPAGPFNDLADAAAEAEPRLGEALDTLRGQLAAPVHVTGSGAAMFLVAEGEPHAESLAKRVTALTGLTAVATRTLGGG